MSYIIKESFNNITDNSETLTGFLSFHDYYYEKYSENLKNELDKTFLNFK